MCDYSLEHYRSRPARLGEKYETHLFESRSIGFIAPGDPTIAVCMACDTKLRLENIPEMVQRRQGVLATALRIRPALGKCALPFLRGSRRASLLFNVPPSPAADAGLIKKGQDQVSRPLGASACQNGSIGGQDH